MTSPAVLVHKIFQTDNHHFTIEWSDGQKTTYRLSDLQKSCSCAHCVDEMTGKRVLDPTTIQQDVRATRIMNVGRYALKIQFTSGCSYGIYRFDFLHSFKTV